MRLEHDPFVATACEDITEGRTREVSVRDLVVGSLPEELDPHEEHLVTDTFLSLWTNLSPSSTVSKATLLSVMRGIRIEPRHPAYRVTDTEFANVYQAQVGDHAVLVFKSHDRDIVWLAVLHRR